MPEDDIYQTYLLECGLGMRFQEWLVFKVKDLTTARTIELAAHAKQVAELNQRIAELEGAIVGVVKEWATLQ